MPKHLRCRDVHTVRISKTLRTSVTVEDEIWERLRIIAITRRITLGRLVAHIDREMRLPPPKPGRYHVRNLTSAIRVFVMLNWPPDH